VLGFLLWLFGAGLLRMLAIAGISAAPAFIAGYMIGANRDAENLANARAQIATYRDAERRFEQYADAWGTKERDTDAQLQTLTDALSKRADDHCGITGADLDRLRNIK
jgi:hypothetical protein